MLELVNSRVGYCAFYHYTMDVGRRSQLLLTLTCEVRPVYFENEALDPGFALIGAHQ